MEDLRKYYQEKRLHQENLGNIEENQMLQHTIDFAKMGLRGVFILNFVSGQNQDDLAAGDWFFFEGINCFAPY